jgi:adenylate kinase
MKLIIMGPPGSGKGTQADLLTRKMNLPIISTGNMLREAIAGETEVGLAAKAYVSAGKLVPDDVVLGIVKERLSRPDLAGGYMLDGFPRTQAQAEALDAMGVAIDLVISIEVADSEIERRMQCRRVCRKCSKSYHTELSPPKKEGTCDACGEAVSIREDDMPEIVRARLAVYHEQSEPVKSFYEAKGKLICVPSMDIIEDTQRNLLAQLEAFQKDHPTG